MLALIALAVPLALAPAAAARPREQDMAFQEAQKGRVMPLPKIEQRVRDHPALRGATYLGPEFNGGTVIYRLKFMRAGRVIWVDVDARTGRILSASGD